MLIPNPELSFWNFDTKIYFWANFGQRSQSCLFCLKIGTHCILRMLILIPTLVFWISNSNFIFGQIWAKKVKVVCFNWKLAHTKKLKVVQFGWKLAHRVSRRCWFLFRHYFSQFPTLNPFLDKFESKNLNSLLCLEASTQSILRMWL